MLNALMYLNHNIKYTSESKNYYHFIKSIEIRILLTLQNNIKTPLH